MVWFARPLCMMSSSNENTFRVTGPLCGEFTGQRWIPFKKASDAENWCLFDLCLNIGLNKQSWSWWFEMPLHSLWRHINVHLFIYYYYYYHHYHYYHYNYHHHHHHHDFYYYYDYYYYYCYYYYHYNYQYFRVKFCNSLHQKLDSFMIL